jgi:hypothetical protein
LVFQIILRVFLIIFFFTGFLSLVKYDLLIIKFLFAEDEEGEEEEGEGEEEEGE